MHTYVLLVVTIVAGFLAICSTVLGLLALVFRLLIDTDDSHDQ